ncbi:DUF4192 domain-containing protein [Mycetocola sp.]|uniref:DUF4192 domain-containing protein n=1 Tax=Mycetocola sp. TaxID=1871042 RepID=UPI003988BAF1
MTTIIKAAEAQDFLALVPHLTGFQPQQSIVLVAFRGNRTCGALRLDLPNAAAPAAARRRAATTMLGLVCRISDVDALVLVVYTDDTFTAGDAMPYRAVIDNILSRARYSGFLVRDALCVASDAWGSYLDEDCPPEGRPLGLIAESPARHTLARTAQQRPLVDVEAESRLPAADFPTREQTAKHYTELESLRGTAELGPALMFDYRFSGDVVGFADDLLRPREEPVLPRDAALLAFLVQAPALRDEVLLSWAWGQEFGVSVGEMNARHSAGEDISDVPGAMALGGFGMPRPDPSRLRAAIRVLRYSIPRLPRRSQAPLVTMLAWMHWSLGSGTLAARWVAQARALDPEHGLAELLDRMLSAGRLPDWAWDVPPDATDGTAIDAVV